MRLGATYSHLNGLEFLNMHHQKLWEEVVEVISQIDAAACKTKVSKEKSKLGKILYSLIKLNNYFKSSFESLGWSENRRTYWVTHDEHLLRQIHSLSPGEQKQRIEEAGYEPILSYNQIDFLKNRVAVEVQFGKYAFVAHDLFVKHMSFFSSDIIDVGIEILPMKELEQEMSSGVPYYERDLLNLVRQGKTVPAVPLVLIGVLP